MSEHYEVGDRIVVKKLLSYDKDLNIKVGHVAKVVWVDGGGDPYCYNPEWDHSHHRHGGREMWTSQIFKLEVGCE